MSKIIIIYFYSSHKATITGANEMKATIDAQDVKIATLEAKIATHEAKIATLEAQAVIHTATIAKYTATIAKNTSDIATINKKYTDLMTTLGMVPCIEGCTKSKPIISTIQNVCTECR